MADLQFIVDYTSLKKANQEILKTGSNAQKSARVFEQAYGKVGDFNNKEMSALRKRITLSERLRKQKERETNAVMKSLDAQRKASQAVINSYQRVKMAADPLYASEVRLKQAQRDVITAYKQGNVTRREAIETMRQYRAAVQNGTLAGQGLNKGMNRMGVLFQQTGYQVGDFAVQVQSGTHYMVALGQQATQLVGTMGMLAKSTKMIALFSGLGILVPILTAVAGGFMRMRENADEAAEGAKNLKSEIESLDKALKDWTSTKKAASMGITTEELLGLGGIEQAEKDLEKATANLNEIRRLTNLEDSNVIASGNIKVTEYLKSFFDADTASKYEAALAAVVKAEARLQTLRAKQRDEQSSTFAEESVELKRQLELKRTILKYGGDSVEAAAKEAEQRRIAYLTEQLQAGISGERLAALMRQYDELAKINSQISASSESMKKLSEKAFSFLEAAKGWLPEISPVEVKMLEVNQLVEDTAGINLAAVFQNANSWLATLLDNTRRLKSGLQGGRSAGRGGPTAEELQREVPEVQLAYAPVFTPSSGASGGGGISAAEKLAKETDQARQALNNLIGTYDDAQARANQLAKAQETVNKALELGVINGKQADQIMQDYTDSLEKAKGPLEKIAETAKKAFGDAFTSIVDGTKSAKDAFKDMARAILKQAFDLLVVKPLMDSLFGTNSDGSIGGLVGRIFGVAQANGGAWDKGVQMFANGGVVNSATAFQHSGGLGVMGEAGPEAIMPLKRGKNGKLGVQLEGGSEQPVVINQSFNFSANGDDSVKRIIAQEAPKIASLTQRQVLEARARGGAFRNTFGG